MGSRRRPVLLAPLLQPPARSQLRQPRCRRGREGRDAVLVSHGCERQGLDAIPYLVERDGTNCENLPDTHKILKELRRTLDEEFDGRIFLAEANQWPSDVIPYFGNSDECHMAFHFPLMPRMYMALRQEDRSPIVEIL